MFDISIIVLSESSIRTVLKRCFVFFVTEIEAKEACKWLRAAGFPQYAQMYEGEYIIIII